MWGEMDELSDSLSRQDQLPRKRRWNKGKGHSQQTGKEDKAGSYGSPHGADRIPNNQEDFTQ